MRKTAAVLAGIAILSLSGMAFGAEIVMNGSTTVLPIAQAAAEKYMAANEGVKISVSGGGSGNGIKAIIDGTTDIANSSRFIKQDEVKAAVEKGTYPVPFAVAMDALLPIVHPDNPVKDLSIDQLQAIYSGKITSWKDVGGEDKPIAVVGRDTSSGTYETWQEIILKKERVSPRALIVASSGAMLTTVAKNKYAIGYDGIGYINKSIKALKVNGVAASAKTAIDGSFPISRALYMFTNGEPKGAMADYLNYVKGKDGQQIVKKEGFVPLQ
jgi:phosphate transport system substrate-binding protein